MGERRLVQRPNLSRQGRRPIYQDVMGILKRW